RLDLDDRLVADADGPSLRIEALAVADGTAHDPHVLLELHPSRPAGCLLEGCHQLRNNALPGAAVFPDAAAALLPLIGDVLLAAAVEQLVALFLRQSFPGRLEVDAERPGDSFVDVFAPASHAPERADKRNGALVETEFGIGNQQIGIE